ncbi:MAG: MBL fold metallo-hydrolase [Myxococcota bacterium]
MFRLTGEVHKLPTFIGASYCVNSDDAPVLIDCAIPIERRGVIFGIKKIGFSPKDIRAVMLTHDHPDHSGNAGYFEEIGVNIYCHEEEAESLKGCCATPSFEFSPPRPVARTIMKTALALLMQRPPIVAHKLFKAPESFLGFEVIHLPGHTKGSVAYLHKSSGTLFCGDALLCALPPWTIRQKLALPEKAFCYDYTQALNSLKKLYAIDFDNLCAGHGKPIIGDADKKVRKFLESAIR